MASGVIGTTLNAAQLGVTLSGVPYAPGCVMALQLINNACSQVAVHKQKSTQLAKRCTSLLNYIHEQAPLLVGTETTVAFDEAEAVLSSARRRVQKWVACGKLERFLKSAQIARDLDRCCSDVEMAMERLQLANPVTLVRMQKHSMDLMQHHHAVLEERLQQLLISREEVERAAQQHLSGGDQARELMRIGQERLIELRHQDTTPSFSAFSAGRQVDESPRSSTPPSPVTTVQGQIEQALLDLQRLTNIPPTIPILNNQVKLTDLSVASIRSGLYSQVFPARWLGQKVALKTLRVIEADDPRNERLRRRFEHEIIVWSKLKHPHVLAMLGIVTNMGQMHIVSPWQSYHALSYRYAHREANPLQLLIQAAKGLEYLHEQQIVHGKLKCSNLLVSEEGTVTISDFGLTKVLTDVVGRSAMLILSNTSAVRWHAPELNEGENPTLTMATDVFAFGMTVLELLTMKAPYSHRLRDVSVVQDLMDGLLPHRPEEPEAVPWMSDALWEALQVCWRRDPAERMCANELLPCLEQALPGMGDGQRH